MKKIQLLILITFLVLSNSITSMAQNFSDQVSISNILYLDWTYDKNWGGSASRWSGYFGFNAYRYDDMEKDYYFRSNNWTKRMVFEGGHNGFRWLGEEEIIDNGKPTSEAKLNTLMSLSSSGNLILGSLDNDGVFGSGNILKFGGTEWNSDPTEIYRYAVSNDQTHLRVRIGDGLSNSDKFIVGSSGNSAGEWTSSMVVTAGGRVGIKNDNPTCELDVAGTIRAEEILVEDIAAMNMNLSGDIAANNITIKANGNTADFVFSDTYDLKDLSEVESFIKTNKHLENIPNATQMEEQGVNLAEMNKLLLQKIEELTLYAIEKDKEVQSQKLKVEKLEEDRKMEQGERQKMEERLARLEQMLLNEAN